MLWLSLAGGMRAEVVIAEFVAENDNGLADADGTHPDWIELWNNGVAAENMDGWYLSDDSQSPLRWPFPAFSLAPGARRIVFASGKNRRDPLGELHANFSLQNSGGYLALRKPTGLNASVWNPYPPQKADISYGSGTLKDAQDLVTANTAGKLLVPANGGLGASWTGAAFNDTAWTTATNRIGYQVGGSGAGLPQSYWTFDDTVANVMATGPEATLVGATYNTSVPGAIGEGKSLHFTRASGNYVSAALDVSETSYTCSFWFRTTMATTGMYSVVGGDLGANGHDRHIYLTGGNIGTRTWNVETITSTGKNYADNQWHHVAHVFGGSVGGQRLYVDGVQVALGAKSSSDFNWQARVNIGFSNDAVNANYHEGEIDDVAIWSEALNATSIASLVSGTPPNTLAGLAPYVGTNVQTAMQNVNASAYLRLPFSVNRISPFNNATLKVRYDDGFVAYIDGVEVARRNAPSAPTFNSTAPINRAIDDALVMETIDISASANLLTNGNHVLAIQALNDSVGSPEFLLNAELSAATLTPADGIYMDPPTPNAVNDTGFLGFVADTNFLPKRGLYTTAQTVVISCATPGATISYTLDGTDPSPSNGTQVAPANASTAPTVSLAVSTTKSIRAMAYKANSGLRETNTDVHSYIFTPQVLTQSAAPAGYPTSWPGRAADYAMDPNVVNTTLPGYSVNDALVSLPTLSMTCPVASLFSPTAPAGIYYDTSQRGIGAERKVSIEWINPDGTPGWQAQCGVRPHGNSSRGHGFTPKHPLRLTFKSAYGYPRLKEDIFHGGVTKFDQILLRACSTDSMPVVDGNVEDNEQRWNNDKATYMRDQYLRQALLDLGHPNCRGVYVHLYLNGLYWGLYNMAERPNAVFFADTFGGDETEWDVMKDFQELNDGTATAWNELAAIVNDTAISDVARCQKLLGNNPDGSRNPAYPIYLHWSSFRDYMITHIAAGAEDWPDHNYWVGRRRGALSEGFRFVVWDQEISNDSLTRLSGRGSAAPFESVGSAPTDNSFAFGPAKIYDKFRRTEPFKSQFRERVHALLFNGGPLSPMGQKARWGSIQATIDKAMVAESARWGDAAGEGAKKRETTWLNNMNYMNTPTTGYWDAIFPIDVQRFRNVSLYPSINEPTFSQNGGLVPSGFALYFASDQPAVYYTLDGTDPMGANGLPSATAQAYAGGVVTTDVIAQNSAWKYLVTATAPSAAWKAVTFNDAAWPEGNGQLGYGDGDETTVLGYGGNAAARYTTTYFRRKFTLTALPEGAKLYLLRDDGAVVYLNNKEIVRSNMHPTNAITYASLASSNVGGADESAFYYQYTLNPADFVVGNNVLAVEVHKVSVSEDDLSFDARLATSANASSAPAILTPGHGTVKVRALSTAGEWSGVNTAYFTVGAELASHQNMVVSELHYHPAAPTTTTELAASVDPDDYEFLELMNVGNSLMDCTGVVITLGVDFHFPTGFLLAPGGRCVLVRNTGAFMARYGNSVPIVGEFENATSLKNSGELARILAANQTVIQEFTYDDAAPWPVAADGFGPSMVLIAPMTRPDHNVGTNWRASISPHGNPMADDALHLTGSATADSNANGWTNLVEYALGPAPQLTHEMTPDGLTLTIPRQPNADDAEIIGEVSTSLGPWTAADLINATDTSLTFRVPATLSTETHLFIRATVRLRPVNP